MKRRSLAIAVVLGALLAPMAALADVIGANTPSLPLTVDRIANLPVDQRAAWTAYLERSQTQMRLDRAMLAAELPPGAARPKSPPGSKTPQMPLGRDADWYGSDEARVIADNIVSFQTPAGGWGKNQDRTTPPRLPGQPYVIGEAAPAPSSGNFDTQQFPGWHYVGTIDNGATISEIRFLARAASQAPASKAGGYRKAAIKGVRYLLTAQFPNGGWPQVWPLEGGYHDAITYNDNALSDVAMLMKDIGAGQGDFAFVPDAVKAEAAASNKRAIDVVLASQVVVNGRKTVWAQQIDALTLAPTSARNYEMPSLSSSESADILLFLMAQDDPTPALKAAVRDGVAWLQAHAIHDQAWTMTPNGRTLVPQAGAGPLWARYYGLASETPIFGERDRTIHDDVNDISLERRNGYAWFGTAPRQAIKTYETWKAVNP